jgi:hypothetical protein
MLRRLALVALAGVIALTAAAFAVARGQGMVAGYAEICAGSGPVMVALNAEGNPVGPAQLCPEAAFFVIGGVAPPPPAPPLTVAPAPVPAGGVILAGRRAPVACARGPPPSADPIATTT